MNEAESDMKVTIWKYGLTPGDNKIPLPRVAKALSIGWQGTELVMWVLMPDDPHGTHRRVERRFLAVATGEVFEKTDTDEYVGTAECGRHGIVAHVFEKKS